MTNIRVNPEALIQKSADLTTVTVRLRDISDEVKHAIDSAPGYDGQFAPLVSAIGWTAVIGGNKNSTSLADHSSDLVKRASAFLAADGAGVQGISAKEEFLPINDWKLILLAGLWGLTVAELIRLILLGGLKWPNIGRLPWEIVPRFPNFLIWPFWPIKPPEPSIPGPIPMTPVEPPLPPSDESPFGKILDNSNREKLFFGIAETVKVGVANTNDLGYPRNGYNGVQSNCTWYAAQAVLAASNGNIKIENFGAAKNWLKNAETYLKNNPDGNISGIDTNPQAGDIMYLSSGHVAFVEKVETINGKTFVTWSEENASGTVGNYSNKEQVVIDGKPILRWRITREISQEYIADKGIKFIHINY